MLSSVFIYLILSSINDLLVLTYYMICAYYSSVNYEIILNYSGSVSQGYSRVGCPDNGLRILARLIARELINKRRQIGVEAGSEVSEEKREKLSRN